MKKLFGDIKFKKDFVLPVVVALICVYIIQPFFSAMGTYSGSIMSFLEDYCYRCAAVYNNDIMHLAAVIAFTLYVANFFKLATAFLSETKSVAKANKTVPQTNTETNENTFASDAVSELEKIKMLKQQIEDIEEKGNQLNKKIKRGRVLTKVIMSVFAFYFLFIFLYVIIPAYHKSTFETQVIKITPYVSTENIAMLKSDWVRMKSKADYKIIYTKVNAAIEQYDLDK